MVKKCIICEKEAKYEVKGGNGFYCEECAEENFGDVSYLVKMEEEAQRLKIAIKGRLSE